MLNQMKVTSPERADLRTGMEPTALTDIAQLDALDDLSRSRPVLIFKHSTSCGISRTALNRLERAWTAVDKGAHTVFYLDLLRFRAISNAIVERYGITHESPQALVIRNGTCVHDASHFAITYAGTIAALKP